MIFTSNLTIQSRGGFFSKNITDDVILCLSQSGIKNGIALVYYRHTTGGITIIEHEAGLMVDFEDMLDKLIPIDGNYAHHLRQFDHNGSAHIRNVIIQPSVTIPIVEGKLYIGDYQEIIMLDMQPDPKPRDVVVQLMGK